jgi:hypothetical protein
MWSIVKELPIKQFMPFVVKAKQKDIAPLRFVLQRDNIFYLATNETFGDVMPDGIKENETVTIWAQGD